jgi:transcriptional regulator GlxA family with amidase domain
VRRAGAAYPDIAVERAPIYTRDGNVETSAGATAGMDLALALVRSQHGVSQHE